ncbi:hypothetical protein CDAR_221281 [Caerostris darwini]|uniref:Uncharacterized protein n=1 Tax=Caerostris darwini TaxID=1538125 RepID=A0AAV4WNZ6_9ARAC|nr:hypothetical protein CDAR_221281 [Caerostris darwini]
MAQNSTLLPTAISLTTSMVRSSVAGTENKLDLICGFVFLILAIVLSIYYCCCEPKLIPYFKRKIAARRHGRRNRRVQRRRNRRPGADLPLAPLRRASATTCLADQPPQEDRRVSRDEIPDTGMEATENVPMIEIPTMTTV